MNPELIKLEKELLKAELGGKCVNKVVVGHDAFIPCYRASCDGYGAYEIDGEVFFCAEYKRLRGKQ